MNFIIYTELYLSEIEQAIDIVKSNVKDIALYKDITVDGLIRWMNRNGYCLTRERADVSGKWVKLVY